MRPLVALVAVALLAASCGSDGAVPATIEPLDAPATIEPLDAPTTIDLDAPTTIDLDAPQPGDDTVDDDFPEVEEDIAASRLEAGRADLRLEVVAAPAVAAPGDQVVVTVVVTSVDQDFVNAPTVVATLPAGLAAGALPAECAVEGAEVRCRVALSILSESGAVPVSADPFDIELVVEASASGTLVVPLAVESLDNPVANDPDPSNNVVEVSISVA